jgi:hypothetical protein
MKSAEILTVAQAKADEEFWEDIDFNEDEEDYLDESEGEQANLKTSEIKEEEIAKAIQQAKLSARLVLQLLFQRLLLTSRRKFEGSVGDFCWKAFQKTWHERMIQVEQKQRFLDVNLGQFYHYLNEDLDIIRKNNRWNTSKFGK